MSTPFLYFEFYNADFKCQVLGIFAFPTTTKPQHPPTCTLHSGFCSQKSWVISWLLNMLGEMFSIYNFKRRSFKFKYLHEMSFKVLLLHVFHSFICLRGIASCIKVRIQSVLNYDYVIFLWKWNWNMNILRQRKKSSFHVQRLICQKNPPKNPTVTVFLVFSLFKLCLICRLNFYKIFQLVYKNLRYSLVYLCILLILLLSHMLVYWKITCLLVIVCPFIAVNQSLHALIISSLQLSIINITQTTENFFAKFKGRWELEIQD